jgi:plasmid maintenance system antidote protein VapI
VRLVESMVDDEGMSIADAARVMGNARQVVSRLYHGLSSPSG